MLNVAVEVKIKEMRAMHSGPESGQFVRKLFFAQKSMEIYFHYHIYIFFRRKLSVLNSILEHLIDLIDKHIIHFFHWKVLQVLFLGPFIKSFLS